MYLLDWQRDSAYHTLLWCLPSGCPTSAPPPSTLIWTQYLAKIAVSKPKLQVSTNMVLINESFHKCPQTCCKADQVTWSRPFDQNALISFQGHRCDGHIRGLISSLRWFPLRWKWTFKLLYVMFLVCVLIFPFHPIIPRISLLCVPFSFTGFNFWPLNQWCWCVSAAELCFITQLSAKLPLPVNQQINSPGLSLSLSLKHSYLDRETSLILRNIAGKPSHLLTKVTPISSCMATPCPPVYVYVWVNEHACGFSWDAASWAPWMLTSFLSTSLFHHLLLRNQYVCVSVMHSAMTCPVWQQYASV